MTSKEVNKCELYRLSTGTFIREQKNISIKTSYLWFLILTFHFCICAHVKTIENSLTGRFSNMDKRV